MCREPVSAKAADQIRVVSSIFSLDSYHGSTNCFSVINRNKILRSIRNEDMVSMDASLFRLYREGMVTIECGP